MKLALVRPNLGDYRSSDAMAPLALGILAARSQGHEVRLYDDKVEPLPERIDADLVAMTVETFTARRAYALADRWRAQGVPMVMGGYHATLLPDEVARHADALVLGDAESAWDTVLRDAAAGRLQARYLGDNTRPLDDYRTDRDIFRGKPYAPVELVQYGRGCRFACDFCSIHAFYGTRLRVRPTAGLCEEIESLPRQRLLFFVDDNLFGTREQLRTLLATLKPLKRRWSCQISIDVARDPRLLDELAEAGCRYVLIGFESVEPANLKQMRKPWNKVAGAYTDVVRALHARDIGIYGTFVFGYDHDTPDTLRRAVDFALEARLDIANFNPLTPTPGSGLYDRLLQEGRMLSPRWWLDPNYRYGDPIFQPARMTPAQLAEGCFEAKRAFYAWRSIGRRVLAPTRSWTPFHLFSSTVANVISRREVYRKQGRLLGA
ncbi:MAG: radical SAM protein [Pseudomonadota bacterium]|nr:radical SAM protein [Pseudomonadota bacterium]